MGSPIDPDLGVLSEHGPVIAVIAAGGALGSLARYGVNVALPHSGGFPWSTFLENTVGCLLLGMLVVVVTELRSSHRLMRPFLGTGVLGGFTTFSTYAVDSITRTSPVLAAAYVILTLVVALGAAWVGIAVARRLGGAR